MITKGNAIYVSQTLHSSEGQNSSQQLQKILSAVLKPNYFLKSSKVLCHHFSMHLRHGTSLLSTYSIAILALGKKK